MSIIDRALTARRSSRRVELKESFQVDAQLITDVAAIANSGGGAVVFRDGKVDAAAVAEKLRHYTDFVDLQAVDRALIVGEAITPIVIDGVVYFRHGAKINAFDLLAVRKVHDIDAKPEFSHKTLFGTRQYSARFLEWLLDRARGNPEFFLTARREYQQRR